MIIDLLTNKMFLCAGGGWFVAQLAKIIIDLIRGEFSLDRLTGAGGMPSSHSATVTGLVIGSLYLYGTSGYEFIISLFLAIIVIYDAGGVRLETQREAQVLNRINAQLIKEGKEPIMEKPLREKMGHTIPQILVGMSIGVVVSLIVCFALPF